MKVVVVFALCICAASALAPADLHHVEAFVAASTHKLRKKYRPVYHLTAPYGWLNDPAGFIYYRRKFHLFYQYHPYDGSWGPIRWGHAVSENLVDWAHYPPALIPREAYDIQGCLTGSVIIHNGYLAVFYTGHVILGNHSQNVINVAVSADGIVFQKYLYNPVLRNDPSQVAEFRNPKVWRFKDTWYMLVGMSEDRRGLLKLYTSQDLYNWRFNNTVASSLGDMGYTWESPDMFEMDGVHVLILSVQGIQGKEKRFRNIYQTGYVVGRLNYNTLQFEDLEISTATFCMFDYGHDFYAAKTVQAPDGRRLLVAWLGMWENAFLESTDGWAGMLTLLREVRFGLNGRLITPPVSELTYLRAKIFEDTWYGPGEEFQVDCKTFELVVNATSVAYDAVISLEWGRRRHYTLAYWADRGMISADRGGEDGVRRADWVPTTTLHLRIFVDRSSIEVFCGEGEVVFSSRIYPRKMMYVKIAGESRLHIVLYKIRESIGYDKKLLEYIKEHIVS